MLSPETLKVLDLAIRVAMYGLAYFFLWLGLISPLVIWKKYEIFRDKKKVEAARIIVKMNKTNEDGEVIAEERKNPPTIIPEEQDHIGNYEPAAKEIPSVIELRKLAKERGLKGFSRMPKDELATKLGY
jgi:hypothetical protein